MIYLVAHIIKLHQNFHTVLKIVSYFMFMFLKFSLYFHNLRTFLCNYRSRIGVCTQFTNDICMEPTYVMCTQAFYLCHAYSVNYHSQ
ncbi:hypothetical protein FKM82_012205 [Ascaphus truei]